jgi:hypothetical protein
VDNGGKKERTYYVHTFHVHLQMPRRPAALQLVDAMET